MSSFRRIQPLYSTPKAEKGGGIIVFTVRDGPFEACTNCEEDDEDNSFK